MLKYNDTPIEDIYPLEIADEGDTRPRAWANSKYIRGLWDRRTDLRPELGYFKLNDQTVTFAAKGMCPRLTLRHSITSNPSTGLWYLMRIKDGSIWLTSTVYSQPWTLENLQTTDEQFQIIPAEIDACRVFVEMCGAGGGGSGGNYVLCGAGGGGGGSTAAVISFIDDNASSNFRRGVNWYVCYIGMGGEGSQDRKKAGDGGATGLGSVKGSLNSYEFICYGGQGADGSTGGARGKVTSTGGNRIFPSIGCDGGNEAGYSTATFDEFKVYISGDQKDQSNTQQIRVYGPHSVESTYTGAGGNSAFGPGAEPSTYTDINGKNGQYPGTGGSGGSSKPFSSSKGGNGANGIINIYY